MKNEVFFRMLNGIEDKYIEKASETLALQQEAGKGISVHAAPKSRRAMWKTVIASVAVTAAAVFGAVFLMRNVGKNGIMLEPVNSYSSSVQSGGSTESIPVTDNDPTELAYKDEMKFKAVDAVDDRLTYKWEVEPDRISFKKTGFIDYEYEIDDSATSLEYLKEFFGNENLFVDKKYWDSWERWGYSGGFFCNVESGTVAYSPAGGKVITASRGSQGRPLMGNSIAVEMSEGKIFVIFHLDEIYVNVGDTVTEGQALGLCGSSGHVMVGETKLGLVIMKKTGYLSKGELHQTFTKDFDGLFLTVTTDKTEYNIDDTIYLTATLENNRDEDVYLYYGGATAGNFVELSPSFDDLIEYPRDDISRDAVLTVVTVKPGVKHDDDFRFVTYTDYIFESPSGFIKDAVIPDLDKPAAPGVHYGKLRILTCPDKEWNDDDITEYELDFSVIVNGESAYGEDDSRTFTHNCDGLILTVTTDKTVYDIGEPIELTATLENRTGEDVTLYYGTCGSYGYDGQKAGTAAELLPRFEHLIEYPVRSAKWFDEAITEIPFKQGEKCVQKFTFQTYTDYIEFASSTGEYKDSVIPDRGKIAEPGVYYGKLIISAYSDRGDITDHSLYFAVTVKGQSGENLDQ